MIIKLKSIIISNFTISNLAGYLENDGNDPMIKSVLAPYDQLGKVTLDDNMECWNEKPDFGIIWTLPEKISKSFNCITNYEKATIEEINNDVDEFAYLLIELIGKLKFIFVPTWVTPPYYKLNNLMDMKNEFGISNIINRMNLRLIDRLKDYPDIYMLNCQNWITNTGNDSFNQRSWYYAKIPFNNAVFKEASKIIKSGIKGIFGKSKKLIILDLDNTLWGGIIGDDGVDKIILGGHDPIGEAFVDFQYSLKALTNCGIILAIVSKNEEDIALDAIKNHPEMVLKIDDFAGWKINWKDKAQNIIDLMKELNLSLDSAIFIDDNPIERERVRTALPEVYVPEWPENKLLYKQALLSLDCINNVAIVDEDKKRTSMYSAEFKRLTLKDKLNSYEDWLATLEIKVYMEEVNNLTLKRVCQLINKTNQMNLTTRRITEAELLNWLKPDNRKLWTYKVIDKFGDSGLTGILSFEWDKGIGKIVDFILSCRVMGRKIEETMIYSIIKFAESHKIKYINAEYIPTEKNKPCLSFLKSIDLIQKGYVFSWNFKDEFKKPPFIDLIMN